MVQKIEFKRLWRGHPINNSIQFPCRLPKTQGGRLKGLPAFANQCAIRMGVSLKAAGVTPEQLPGVGTCWYHPRSEMHFLVAEKLARGLDGASIPGLGRTEKIRGEAVQDFYNAVFGRTGIIFFKDYWSRSVPAGKDEKGETVWIKERTPSGDHIDVWNGYRSGSGWLMEWFSWLGYYGTYEKSKEIWFWEVA